MSLTNAQLLNLPFGYLTGRDLVQYCAPQLLIKQYEVNPDALMNGCTLAYSIVIGKLSTRYDIISALLKVGFTNADATAVLSGDGVGSITIDYAGTGYGSTAPLVSITGNGTGATAVAIVSNGKIIAINITNAGSGYTQIPTINIADGNQNNRCTLLVDIVSILAVRKALGNVQNVSVDMNNNFKWADTAMLEIQQGILNLILPAAASAKASIAHLVDSNFLTIG